MTLPIAQIVYRAGQWPRLATGRVVLGYDERFLRRKRLHTAAGEPFMVDLADTTNLLAGDAFGLPDGRLIEIAAADEDVLIITGDLARLAWHIGNRHTPCQIEPARLVIRADHVLADMLRGLGASITAARAPFTPEGGAYGLGRTMGHAHGGHAQGGHAHGGHAHGEHAHGGHEH